MNPAPPDVQRIPLRNGSLALHATGFRHPRGPWSRGEGFTPYAELTHVTLTARGLRIASRGGAVLLRSGEFFQASDAVVALHQLRERVALLPDGRDRLDAMDVLDRRLASRPRPRLARGLVLACLVGFGLQWLFFPSFDLAAMFSADLVRAGEFWRLVTANFLHGGFSHLILNAIGLFLLGSLLEGTIGLPAAAFVVAASALGAMLGSTLADYISAVGASGIVAGLAGALIWLEFRRPQLVPAPWRLPRRLLVGALLVDTLLLSFLPSIAHAAHAGGFLAGAGAAMLVTTGDPRLAARPRWLPAANALAAALGVASVMALAWSVWSPDDMAVHRRAERVLVIEGVHPQIMNNEAWMIAISDEPGEALLDVALRLAERAVTETGRADPNLLDTLAEVLFVSGNATGAVSTIDEAIVLAPGEDYFREQRRRFTGDREAGDRPEPPDVPIDPLPLPLPDEAPGFRV